LIKGFATARVISIVNVNVRLIVVAFDILTFCFIMANTATFTTTTTTTLAKCLLNLSDYIIWIDCYWLLIVIDNSWVGMGFASFGYIGHHIPVHCQSMGSSPVPGKSLSSCRSFDATLCLTPGNEGSDIGRGLVKLLSVSNYNIGSAHE
jgi:hypothetical protein